MPVSAAMEMIVFPPPSSNRPPHMLISMGAHCLGSLVPFFAPGAAVPQTWKPYENQVGVKYAYMLAKLIQNNVDSPRGGGRTHYGELYPTIDAMRDPYEASMYSRLGAALQQLSTMPDGQQKTALMDATTQSIAADYFDLLTNTLEYVNQNP
jgi:hypothetical protein